MIAGCRVYVPTGAAFTVKFEWRVDDESDDKCYMYALCDPVVRANH